MTETQIENIKALCKGNPVTKIEQLLRFYRDSDVEDMAKALGCPSDRTSVAKAIASEET